ncbi:unnamed protein product [Cunninghamella blakesleeana]
MSFWNSSEFINWLKQKLQQLTSFEFPFEFYRMDPYYYLSDINELGINEKSKRGNSYYDKDEIDLLIDKWYKYLNHLKKNYLTNECDILHTYYYLVNHMDNGKTVASTSLTSLTLAFIGEFHLFDDEDVEYDYTDHYHDKYGEHAHKSYNTFSVEEENNKSGDLVHFHSWLSAFPKLSQLFITHCTLTDSIILNNFEGIPDQQIQTAPYVLIVIGLSHCKIHLQYGLNTIGNSYPSLKILRLDHVHVINNYNHIDEVEDDENELCINYDQITLMNTPHLALSELWFKNICINFSLLENCSSLDPIFIINESLNNTSFNSIYPLCVFGKTTWRFNYCSNKCSNGAQGPTYNCGKSSGYKYYVTGGDAITDRKWRTTRGLNTAMQKCCNKAGKKACTFLHSTGVDWAQVYEVTSLGIEAAGVIRGK